MKSYKKHFDEDMKKILNKEKTGEPAIVSKLLAIGFRQVTIAERLRKGQPLINNLKKGTQRLSDLQITELNKMYREVMEIINKPKEDENQVCSDVKNMLMEQDEVGAIDEKCRDF